jgi:hypothetical protein
LENNLAKRILLFILQFFAFFGLLDLGGNWDVIRFAQEVRALQKGVTAFNPIPVIKTQVGDNHILIANGLIFAAVLLVLILLFEAIRKALKPWAALSLLAFILATAAALALKMGLPS